MSLQILQVINQAREAGKALAGLERPYIQLGCTFSLGQVQALATAFGGVCGSTLYINSSVRPKPYVIFSIHGARVGNVEVYAQGSREATPEDVGLPTHWSDRGREATHDEVRAALGTL